MGTLLKVSEPLGKCHIALENMGVIFKNLLILISNIITDYNYRYMISISLC